MVSDMGRNRPTISILTPTWERNDEVVELIQHIKEQDYEGVIEHCIVSDGPNYDLYQTLSLLYRDEMSIWNDSNYRIKYAECGMNWSTFLPDSYTAIPLMTATALASSEYHMWLADDERMLVPDHITKLMNLIIEKDVDFVYSQVQMSLSWQPGFTYVIGKPTPEYGQMTHCLYNRRILKKGMYRPFVGSAGDWDVISRWINAGATWAFLEEVTLSHKADK